MENIKQLASLRRKLDTAQAEFAGLLGMYPSTEIKLAGAEYGNFAIPSMRAKIQQFGMAGSDKQTGIESFDNGTSKEELELVIKDLIR